jgi:hypothetical protein
MVTSLMGLAMQMAFSLLGRDPDISNRNHVFATIESCHFGGCVPKTLSGVMTWWNSLSRRNDRAALFLSGRLGLAIQVEVAA